MREGKGQNLIAFEGPLFEPFTYWYKYTTRLGDSTEIQVTLQEWNQTRLSHDTNIDHISTGLAHILETLRLVQSMQ